jgi:hypothetical protein
MKFSFSINSSSSAMKNFSPKPRMMKVSICFVLLFIAQVKRILGTKQEYYSALASLIYFDPTDPELWREIGGEKELRLILNPIANKDKVKNIWVLFKSLLRDISLQKSLTGAEFHKYDRVSLSQLLFIIAINNAKRRIVISNLYSNLNRIDLSLILLIQTN